MCGIVGIVGHRASVSTELLERATRSLAHRGPDDHGTIVIREESPEPVEIGLGNRRLAILDLSPLGHQPMQDPSTGNWIVYNGEIYNFRDVRRELQQSGASFVSDSDTEVLLKAYFAWGEQCLLKFRGMFAFAIWDAGQHRLFIARDPMGIKPLYYAQSGGYFIFASEVRTLLGTGFVPSHLSQPGLTNYLTFGSAYDPITLIDGISALPAGEYLTWKRGEVSRSSYWNLVGENRSIADNTEDRAAAAANLRPMLEDAVRQQLVSDVPVGIFLSGGIDSSALVSIVKRGGVTPSTFSIVFREAEFSEAEHSRAVARQFQTDHHEITVSQSDVLAAIPGAFAAMDSPTMDGINTFFISRETRAAGIKVVLSGLGGDEVFAGYSSFRAVPRMERARSALEYIPRPLRTSIAYAATALVSSSDQSRKLNSFVCDNGHLIHPYFLSRMLFTRSQVDSLLASSDSVSSAIAAAEQRALLKHSSRLDPVNRVSYLESRCYMLNTLLRDADFMSMSQGLELRVPLIDHQLASAVLTLPGSWKLNGSTPKKLLVEALNGTLPDQIVHRPKRGFTLPFERWMREELRAEIEPVLTKTISSGPLANVLRMDSVRRVWQDFLAGKTSWTRPWSLFVLHRWCELHL